LTPERPLMPDRPLVASKAALSDGVRVGIHFVRAAPQQSRQTEPSCHPHRFPSASAWSLVSSPSYRPVEAVMVPTLLAAIERFSLRRPGSAVVVSGPTRL
jgi:hypothetical protein